MRITQFADKLEQGLDELNWPEGTLTSQRQWIGRSTGASIKFKVDLNGVNAADGTSVEVYTTRPDTIMGVTYLVLAPEHSLVASLTTADNQAAVSAYLTQMVGKSDLERTSIGVNSGKTGVFLGSYAVHPLTGAVHFEIVRI